MIFGQAIIHDWFLARNGSMTKNGPPIRGPFCFWLSVRKNSGVAQGHAATAIPQRIEETQAK